MKVLEYDHKPFGDSLSFDNVLPRLAFGSEERDEKMGYYQMGRRLYDPAIGRFMAVDPLFEDGQEHSFVFQGYKIEVTYQGVSLVTDENNDKPMLLNCFPNPASDYIEIGGIDIHTLNGVDESVIRIFITTRECILTLEQTSPPVQRRINISRLTSGMYSIKLVGKTRKLLIKR